MQRARPALPIEATFLGGGLAPAGEVWHTHAAITGSASGGGGASAIAVHYVLAANLSAPFLLAPSDVGAPAGSEWRAWDTAAGGGAPQPVAVDAGHPLPLPVGVEEPIGGVVPFGVWALSPVLAGGWVFLGEGGSKFMPVSAQRFAGLATNESEARVAVTMTSVQAQASAAEEVVAVRFLSLCIRCGGRAPLLCTAKCSGVDLKRQVRCVNTPPSCACTCD